MSENETKRAADGAPTALRRVVGVPGAILMGLGSILGTGIFVSVGIAAGISGPSVLLAVLLAAALAAFNGLSSAQLAASHPVSGGTYEYGYRYLSPGLGFSAGWLFLAAKSASAATAALGFSGYLLTAFGQHDERLRVGLALLLVLVLTLVVAGGIQRSNRTNALIVGSTLAILLLFVFVGATRAGVGALERFRPFFDNAQPTRGLLQATALMFVAYTGYGRIATLGEEVRDPRRSIPRAIVITLLVTMLLYVAVVAVAIGLAGATTLADATRTAAAPLEVVARRSGVPGLAWLVALGAITAMVGVLLNLLLGLSRVLLAMGRRGDMPSWLAVVEAESTSPRRAVLVTGGLIAAIVCVGRVELTWSFSAFTVLVYYALTNLAALRLPADERRFPRVLAWLGLASCLALAFFVETRIWLAGLALIALGFIWRAVARRLGRATDPRGSSGR